ncbi:MAG: cytochrome c [bacterium]|nr:cytochrome c [bacterium]
MKRISPVILTVAAIVTAISTLPALGEQEVENKGFMAAKGRVTFNRYCASCHGEKADGTGPVARMLKVAPKDLRMLTIENDGEYPGEELAEYVDGRKEVRAHGSRDMPVWGEVFQTSLVASPASPDEAGEDRAARKIRELVLYVETIQQAPKEEEAEDR